MAANSQTMTAVKPTERNNRRIGRFTRIMLYIFLVVFTFTYMLPFFSAILTSVRTQDDLSLNGVFSIPNEITLQNYPQAWTQGRVSRYLLNSFIITIPALIGAIFLSSLSAFALARYKFRGNRFAVLYVRGRNDVAFPDFVTPGLPAF
jgi:multiple sugar transport system permease protein